MLGRLYLSEGQSAESDYFRVEHYTLSISSRSLSLLFKFIFFDILGKCVILCYFRPTLPLLFKEN